MNTTTTARMIQDSFQLALEPAGVVVESYYGSRYRTVGNGDLIAEKGGSGGYDAYEPGHKVAAGSLQPPFTVVEEAEVDATPKRERVVKGGTSWSNGTHVRSRLSSSPQRLVIETSLGDLYLSVGDGVGPNQDGVLLDREDLKEALASELGWNVLTDDEVDDLIDEQATVRIEGLGLVAPKPEPETFSMEVDYTTGTGSDVINDVVRVEFSEEFIVFVGPDERLEFMAPTRTVQSIARL